MNYNNGCQSKGLLIFLKIHIILKLGVQLISNNLVSFFKLKGFFYFMKNYCFWFELF